jgi:hypothetical protein
MITDSLLFIEECQGDSPKHVAQVGWTQMARGNGFATIGQICFSCSTRTQQVTGKGAQRLKDALLPVILTLHLHAECIPGHSVTDWESSACARAIQGDTIATSQET